MEFSNSLGCPSFSLNSIHFQTQSTRARLRFLQVAALAQRVSRFALEFIIAVVRIRRTAQPDEAGE